MINIIIPYYNNRGTIERALHSIAMQTYKNRTIVTIVDDCSTEKYLDKFFDFLENKFSDLNLQFLKTNYNQGPGGARNYGLLKNLCDWVIFMDADDAFCSSIAVEFMYKEAAKNNAVMLSTSFWDQHENGIYKRSEKNFTWLHGKIFNANFLRFNRIFFPERMNEDSAFIMKIRGLADNIYTLDFTSCIWMNNKKSITRSDKNYYLKYAKDFLENYYDVCYFFDTCKNVKNKDALLIEMLNVFYYQRKELLFLLKKAENKSNKKDIGNELKEYDKVLKKFLKYNKIKTKITNKNFVKEMINFEKNHRFETPSNTKGNKNTEENVVNFYKNI